LAGQAAWLTPLQYQQSAGRAGRRGHDYVGQTIFFGLPQQKVAMLMSAPLPRLPPLFYMDTFRALQLVQLLQHKGTKAKP
jgi:superfamily II RNA helicase